VFIIELSTISHFFHIRWVLTAAHCLPQGDRTSRVVVHIGKKSPVSFSQSRTSYGTEKYRVRTIFVHPNYAGSGFSGMSYFQPSRGVFFI